MRRIVSLTLALILWILATPLHAQDQPAPEWPKFDGIWATSRGQLALWQADDAVYGVYEKNGTLGGHIDADGILRFSYEEGSDDMGSGWLQLNVDGASFTGEYTSSTQTAVHGSWDGTFLGLNSFDVGDIAALEYVPGQEIPVAPGTEVRPPQGEVPPEITTQPSGETTVPTPSAWNGTWDTARGTLVLAVDGVSIEGSFAQSGVLEGTIEDATVRATWRILETGGSETSGECLFTISDDAKSFRGTYDDSAAPDLWLPWQGTKVSDDVTGLNTNPQTPAGSTEEVTEVTPLLGPEVGAETVPAETEAAPEATEAAPAETSEQPAEEETASEETGTPEETGAAEETEEPVVHKLVITATGDCWTTVKSSDGQLLGGLMTEGDTFTFEDTYGFYLRAGAPENLTVQFDGEDMKWEEGSFVMILPPEAADLEEG